MKRFNRLGSLFRRRADATAFVNGSDKYPEIKGIVLFYQLNDGVIIRAEITGLPKKDRKCEDPIFAFHIHNGRACTGNKDDAFAEAGTHFNPYDCHHPYHAGDLPPLFSADGNALSVCLTNRFTVSDVVGKPVVIHLSPDDFSTQPSGNSGEKIACGIIEPTNKLHKISY